MDTPDALISILTQFNPWWRNETVVELPEWRRTAFQELFRWVVFPPTPRAILLSGARQIGKTTLILQLIQQLIKEGVPPANILYVTFDHPLLKMAGIEKLLRAWREREPKATGKEYLLLDEAQCLPDWGTWIKHQVDFNKNRTIVFTGSATPLMQHQESGVGRWHTIQLTTLSFYEYLQLKQLELPLLPTLTSLRELHDWSPKDFFHAAELALPYVGHFHEYLLKGGFPQLIAIHHLDQAQRLLREDLLDKALKRDMTALYGARKIFELEQTFLYLCMHDGGLLDIPTLCENLGLKRPTIENFIELFQATHLIYRLAPFGYGKEILRGKYKIYLADSAIAPSLLLKGKSLLQDPQALGVATETAVFKHLFARYYQRAIRFSYWRNKKNHEVDLIAEIGDQLIPFEIKYRNQHTHLGELTGLVAFCQNKAIPRAYVITKSLNDFGSPMEKKLPDTKIMRIPAPLFCYWMGKLESSSTVES